MTKAEFIYGVAFPRICKAYVRRVGLYAKFVQQTTEYADKLEKIYPDLTWNERCTASQRILDNLPLPSLPTK